MISITVDGVAYEVPSNASDTNWAAKQVAFEQAMATAVNAALLGVDSPTWSTVAPNGLWTNIGGAQPVLAVTKDPAGWVSLRGAVHNGDDGDLATLSSTYYPLKTQTFILPCGTSLDKLCVLTVDSAGAVSLTGDLTAMAQGTYINVRYSTS